MRGVPVGSISMSVGVMVKAWTLPRVIKVSWPRIEREELVHTAHSIRV